MNKSRLVMSICVLLISLVLVGVAVAADLPYRSPRHGLAQEAQLNADHYLEGVVLDGDSNATVGTGTSCTVASSGVTDSGIESLSLSYMAFDPSAGGDICRQPGTEQTFCFRAESYTTDYAYVYSLFQKFPSDWQVNNVYLGRTPSCDHGSWGTFSWAKYQGRNHEIAIYHIRYQGINDHCVAYYCFDVIPGTTGDVSWYWSGDDYGSPPDHPCSRDGYSPNPLPSGGHPCDEAVNPLATVPSCADLEPTCQNASVSIDPGDIELPVNPATGEYGPVLLFPGVYLVEASASGYSTESTIITITDQAYTTQDFLLFRPVIEVDPNLIDATIEMGMTTVVSMEIENQGHQPLRWELIEVPLIQNMESIATSQVDMPATPSEKFEAGLMAQLQTGPADFFIWLAEKADLHPAYALTTKAEKGQYVFNALTAVAERTQKGLRAYLDQAGVDYQAFYIANKILVRGGSQSLALAIASRADVYRLTANHAIQLEAPVRAQAPAQPQGVESNISFVKAEQVWALGYTGQGIVLAGNDTGLDETVSTIAPHYRGCLNPPACTSWDHNYNWWDATGTYPDNPYDGHGNGTQTTGIMVGDDGGANQIGMAPGSQTIHCKNMTNSGGGDDGTFTECFQWDLAPWDLTGANPDPTKAPDAINNSWGYTGGNYPVFVDEITALQAAGILVEASAGNEGASCSTLRSPADYINLLTTGMVDHLGTTFPGMISDFSSRGPSLLYPSDYIPDILAPGDSIRSQVPGGDFESWTGSGMAGPHATGLVALMWSANPALRGNVVETIRMIQLSSSPLTGQRGLNCGGNYISGPNNDWGYGTMDALAAVQLAQAGQDLPWVSTSPVTGTIGSMDSQLVDVTLDCTQTLVPTILNGALRIEHNDPCSGSVNVPVQLTCSPPATYGRLTGTVSGLGYCDADPAPLVGAVVHISSGNGTEWELLTDENGHYDLWLDEANSPLEISVTSPEHLSLLAGGTVIVGGQTTTQDFSLRWDQPCVVATPLVLEVGLELGETATLPLQLSNQGAHATGFALPEYDLGYTPPSTARGAADRAGKSSTDIPHASLSLSAPVDVARADVLLIQDVAAWEFPAITSILGDNNIAYDLINSSQIASWDFSPYTMIIIPSVQGNTYNTHFNASLAKFESFINAGGKLLMSFCEQYGYTPYRLLPFGGTSNHAQVDHNYLAEPLQPIFAGVPNPYHGTSASHNYLTGLLPGDLVMVTAGDVPGGNPVMIERHVGDGLLVAGGQTFEFGWAYFQPAGTILANMIPYYYFEDIPWLSEDIQNGTLPADSPAQVIEVTFDASNPAIVPSYGTYRGRLRLISADPVSPQLDIPVIMHVAPDADLAITKSASPPEVRVGEEIEYTLVVMNQGPQTALAVTLTDPLPAEVQFVSGVGCSQAAGVVTCELGNLANNASQTIHITVEALQAGTAVNVAQAITFSFDDDASDNVGVASTSILPAKQEFYLPFIQK